MTLIDGVFIGLVATVLVDVWAWILAYLFKLPTTNWAMVGRWVGHMPDSQFVHQSIADTLPVAGELIIGKALHYTTGLIYGVGYMLLVVEVLNQTPTLVTTMVYSLVLLIAPWFIMQPGLGLGMFANQAPKPWLIRGLSASVHIIFGIGLYVGWILVR